MASSYATMAWEYLAESNSTSASLTNDSGSRVGVGVGINKGGTAGTTT